jgi:hypothetical protein
MTRRVGHRVGAMIHRCGNDAPQCGPHSDETKIQRADKALDALTQMWSKSAEKCPADAMNEKSATELANEFCRALYDCPGPIDMGLTSGWVREHYPLLCRSFGILWPPPYKDFARELARPLPRKRRDRRPGDGGKRHTYTCYWMPRPASTVVVALSEEKRKRA